VTETVDHKKRIVGLVRDFSRGRFATWQIWQDFVMMASCSISNAVDVFQKDKREEEYLSIAKRYTAQELDSFTKILVETTLALEEKVSDILGECYMERELYSKWKGQFFTPEPVCRAMADMLSVDEAGRTIAGEGFVTVLEPCIGSGAMMIGLHQARLGVVAAQD
jgi:type I restriction-modification system DNA methylase subunit